MAQEISKILKHFGVRGKVVAATVDSAGNMDVAVQRLNVLKIGCFEPDTTKDPEVPDCIELGGKSLGSCGVDEEVLHGQSCPQGEAATPE